jgi:lathosterol oxidase
MTDAALPTVSPARAATAQPHAIARWIDRTVFVAGTLSGLAMFPPRIWFAALARGFVGIAGAVIAGSALAAWIARRVGTRIQSPSRKPTLRARGALDTACAAWMAACFLAWPLARVDTHHAIGLVWSLGDAGGSPWRLVAQSAAAIVVMDAWLYWKHRLLHTRWFFGFHREHHVFRDPTSFASFAIGPVESVLTFWPIVLLCIPSATHWAPLYFALIVAFVVLNYYLHCGVTLRWIEAPLASVFVNTSAFHNVHHANAGVNFGEALTVWDRLCGTRARDVGSK